MMNLNFLKKNKPQEDDTVAKWNLYVFNNYCTCTKCYFSTSSPTCMCPSCKRKMINIGEIKR
jgi:Zn finger protein HypA/HybF involved in hydrogenase expression